MGNYRMGLFFSRSFVLKDPAPPKAVRDAFTHHTSGGSPMTTDQLRQFLASVQGEPEASIADAERLVEAIRRGKETKSEKGISIDEFYQLLFSVELNPPIRNQVHHDMTAPASHYYIYTGHNSYLTGNQLSSDCSDVPVIKALKRGVRVIELDIWPNSDEDGIDVLHGRTLTSPVEFGRCLSSIKKHAFEASPYPVIITLEDHLTPDLQSKAAQMITETFGDMLFYPPSDDVNEFPSPESLKHRILISTKPPKEYLDSEKKIDGKNDDNKSSHDLKKDEDDNDDDDNEISKQLMNSAPEYRRLITIHAGKPKGGMIEALNVDPNRVRRLSLSENQLREATTSYGNDVIRFTQRNILRVYPKGTRLTSSNYDPFIGWMHGAQMVAFNMQGFGKPLWLMQGFFKANGGCGFVKKPDFLRLADGVALNPTVNSPVKKLKVTVYMGDGWRMDFDQTHFDPYSPPDFYVVVGIVGAPSDCMKMKTKVKKDEWTPVWDEEFTFPLTVPEIAVLRIEVKDYDQSRRDDFGGQTCLPVSELRTGIRAVPLCDMEGEQLKSVKLLVHFAFC